jgi:8-oxo-dGTP pyrophosphatase MutT (NUDIX family)
VTLFPSVQRSAALPFRFDAAGRCEVLLITSSRTRRRVIPKGDVAPPLSPALSAAREAVEEAGVGGAIEQVDVGAYRYEKRRADGSFEPRLVRVFPLAVSDEPEDRPERSKRDRRWFDVADALQAVEEPEPRAILAGFARDPHGQPVTISAADGVSGVSWPPFRPDRGRPNVEA